MKSGIRQFAIFILVATLVMAFIMLFLIPYVLEQMIGAGGIFKVIAIAFIVLWTISYFVDLSKLFKSSKDEKL